MKSPADWQEFWEQKARAAASDFEIDRLSQLQNQVTDEFAEKELINFVSPQPADDILDAGCGTGINITRFHSRARTIVGIDYSASSLDRCRKRIQSMGIANARVQQASVTAVPLPDRSVDKVLCLSVFHYLSDDEVRQSLREFVRVLRPGGEIFLHVKNLSSLYWSTLRPVKKLKGLLNGYSLTEHIRSFGSYVKELESAGCALLDFESFDLLTVDRMPGSLVSSIREFEMNHRRDPLFRTCFARRHGAELMMRARTPHSL